MAVNLKKGGKVNLSKEAPGLFQLVAGLGWDVNHYDGESFDLDASVFLLNNEKKCANSDDFVFYNQPHHPSGAVIHMGDNRTGSGNGDDEQIEIDLSKIPENITHIPIVVTIHDAEQKNQNFGQVENAYIHLLNKETGEEVVRYDLTEDYSTETALNVGELYKKDGTWRFAAVGSGFQEGLAGFCRLYGLEVE